MKTSSFAVYSALIILLTGFLSVAIFFFGSWPVFAHDFRNGITGWEASHISNIPDEWNLEPRYDEASKEYFLNIQRKDSIEDPDDGDGGLLGIGRSVNIDVEGIEHLYIRTNVRVFEHNLGGSGFYDDSIPDGVGEYPLGIWIHYEDADGEARRYLWGFLTEPNINLKTNYDLVARGEWRTFVSEDLMAALIRPARITRVEINGRGWDFWSNIGGKFEILRKAPSAESNKFPPSLPASELSEIPTPA